MILFVAIPKIGMRMKILICGKGGSGKSTIAALLAKS